MEKNRRQKQVGSVLKRAISEYLEGALDFEAFGLVTVIDVTISPQRSKADIWVSALQSNAKLQGNLDSLIHGVSQVIQKYIHAKRRVEIEFHIAG